MLYAMNPNKFRICQYLIEEHERRGDKVLVFSDNIFALQTYSKTLGKPYIYGGTSDHERRKWLYEFQKKPDVNCLFISKVGDNSIDLPDVNVIIQVSSHFSSRRQEAQRLGRILRPKSRSSNRFNAFFYTLVSTDTKEVYYATKRQRFLVDQGYSFQVVPDFLQITKHHPNLVLTREEDRAELLARVMAADDELADIEHLDENNKQTAESMSVAKRVEASIKDLSGGGRLVYGELGRGFKEASSMKPKRQSKSAIAKSTNALFNRRKRELKELEKLRKSNAEAAKDAAKPQ